MKFRRIWQDAEAPGRFGRTIIHRISKTARQPERNRDRRGRCEPYDSKLWVYDVRRVAVPVKDAGFEDYLPEKIRRSPEFTSMGPVAIQLRRAVETMGLDFTTLTEGEKNQLVSCLQNSDDELAIVSRHLWMLKQIDFKDNRTGISSCTAFGNTWIRC